MRRTGISVVIVICLTFLNPLLPQLNAKMSVISPEDMIGKSDHIVVGIIKNWDYTENHREVTISIDTVLKGDINQNQIVLKRDIDAMHRWVTFDFPKEGDKVMVLLRNTTNGYSPTYANSVCIIKNNRVYLFEGMGFGSNNMHWLPNDYEKTYQAFYENALSLRLNKRRTIA
ncbi:hypothetical protein QFZ81_003656 [Paenibacillus sp. V4I9]|uniref:hypothetical protein n=1 Tax=Paenibacillus sp. V4I9 TaxID=3042308 RepID=UPI00278109E7|nr:hypothetical protein [Paenibacillus sp. V4I9]MDQ0888568.1 hypothetical protein [Paenibacillus sp. V4I9]